MEGVGTGKRFFQLGRQLWVIGFPDCLARLQPLKIDRAMLEFQLDQPRTDGMLLLPSLLQHTIDPSPLFVIRFPVAGKHHAIPAFDRSIQADFH